MIGLVKQATYTFPVGVTTLWWYGTYKLSNTLFARAVLMTFVLSSSTVLGPPTSFDACDSSGAGEQGPMLYDQLGQVPLGN